MIEMWVREKETGRKEERRQYDMLKRSFLQSDLRIQIAPLRALA